MPFEEALERLEEIVQKLDEGDLPLEDSIEMFEEGMRLKKTCLRRLNEAEAVVEQYTEPENQQVDEAEPDNNNDDSECKQEPRLEVDDQ